MKHFCNLNRILLFVVLTSEDVSGLDKVNGNKAYDHDVVEQNQHLTAKNLQKDVMAEQFEIGEVTNDEAREQPRKTFFLDFFGSNEDPSGSDLSNSDFYSDFSDIFDDVNKQIDELIDNITTSINTSDVNDLSIFMNTTVDGIAVIVNETINNHGANVTVSTGNITLSSNVTSEEIAEMYNKVLENYKELIESQQGLWGNDTSKEILNSIDHFFNLTANGTLTFEESLSDSNMTSEELLETYKKLDKSFKKIFEEEVTGVYSTSFKTHINTTNITQDVIDTLNSFKEQSTIETHNITSSNKTGQFHILNGFNDGGTIDNETVSMIKDAFDNLSQIMDKLFNETLITSNETMGVFDFLFTLIDESSFDECQNSTSAANGNITVLIEMTHNLTKLHEQLIPHLTDVLDDQSVKDIHAYVDLLQNITQDLIDDKKIDNEVLIEDYIFALISTANNLVKKYKESMQKAQVNQTAIDAVIKDSDKFLINMDKINLDDDEVKNALCDLIKMNSYLIQKHMELIPVLTHELLDDEFKLVNDFFYAILNTTQTLKHDGNTKDDNVSNKTTTEENVDNTSDEVAGGTEDKVADGTVDKVADGTVDKVADGTVDKVANGTVDKVADGTEDKVADGTEDKVADGTEDKVAGGTEDKVANATSNTDDMFLKVINSTKFENCLEIHANIEIDVQGLNATALNLLKRYARFDPTLKCTYKDVDEESIPKSIKIFLHMTREIGTDKPPDNLEKVDSYFWSLDRTVDVVIGNNKKSEVLFRKILDYEAVDDKKEAEEA